MGDMRSFLLNFAVLVAAILAAPTSLAQTIPGAITVTPFGSGSFGGTFEDEESELSVSLEDSGALGVILNYQNSANTQYELIYSQLSTDANVSGATIADINIQYLQAGGTYQFEGNKVLPFMSATLGGTRVDVDEAGYGSDTFFGFSIGGGLQIAPSKRLGLRLEARAFGTLVSSGSSIFCVSDPGNAAGGCVITVAGDVLWQVQTMAGFVFRF
jgi:opacity protein-like surface antigen